jgi:amino acid transporter
LPFIAVYLAGPGHVAPEPQPGNLLPLLPDTWSIALLTGVGSAMLGVLWAYHGWMNVTLVAEEVKDPRRNIPFSLVGGTLIVIGLYVTANFAYYLVIPGNEIAAVGDTTVATVFCRRLLGPIGGAVASAAVMCSVFGALNGNLLVGPRVLYAASADGLAPRGLAAIHPRFRTPARAILVQGGFSSLLVLGIALLTRIALPTVTWGNLTIDINLPRGPSGQVKSVFNTLTDYAMFGAIIFETMAVATIFPLRRLYPHRERPYRCWGYPFVPAFYVLVMALVLVNTCIIKQTESLIGGGFIILGAAVYFLIALTNRHGTVSDSG